MNTQLCKTIASRLHLPASMVANIDRRLGEAGVIPRVTRGHRRVPYKPDHLADVLIGCMCMAQDRAVTLGQVVRHAQAAGALTCRPSSPEIGSEFRRFGVNIIPEHTQLRDLLRDLLCLAEEGAVWSHPAAIMFSLASLPSGGRAAEVELCSRRSDALRDRHALRFGTSDERDLVGVVRMSYECLRDIAEAWGCERDGLAMLEDDAGVTHCGQTD